MSSANVFGFNDSLTEIVKSEIKKRKKSDVNDGFNSCSQFQRYMPINKANTLLYQLYKLFTTKIMLNVSFLKKKY